MELSHVDSLILSDINNLRQKYNLETIDCQAIWIPERHQYVWNLVTPRGDILASSLSPTVLVTVYRLGLEDGVNMCRNDHLRPFEPEED